MTSRRPGSGRSTHGAWSLDPNDQGRTDLPKIAGSGAAKISLASGVLLWLVKWVAAAILAGAGIWGGVTWAIILRETEWRWIAVAIAVEAVILAGAIVTPELRPKMLLGAGVAVFMTAITVARSMTGCRRDDAHELHPVGASAARISDPNLVCLGSCETGESGE